jgi:hypothetical protein
MAITLRLSDNTPAGKVTELSYDEMNDNLRSFYYSSSFQSNTLVLYTTGSVSHSISLAAFLDDTNTNIYNTDGALTGNRTVTLDGNELTFVADQAETFTIATDPSSVVAITDLPTTVASSTVGINPSTGQLSAMSTGSMNYYSSASVNLNTLTLHRGNGGTSVVTIDTGSGGGSASPGGSDTQVQFNDGGSTFGGDSGFTYNKTTNRVTITATGSATRTAPNLLLNSELGNVTVGEVFGVIAANNTTDTYSPANYPASIQFTADTNFTPGNYDARIGLFVNNNATETEALRLRSSGQNRLPQYGSGTFTGTVAKYLAVSASGDVIETSVAGPNLTQPTATTHTFNGDISNDANYAWEVEVGSGTSAPSAAGKMRIGHSSPGNKNTSTITAISFHRTSSNSTNTSNVLDYLCENGTMVFRSTGGALVADTLIIKEVDESNANYVIVYVAITSGTNADIATSTTYRMDFQSDALIRLADQNYNRIVLNNLAAGTLAAVLVPPTTAAAGDYYLVEVTAGSSNDGSFAVNYATYVTGATTTYDIARTAARYLAGTNTVTAITLDYSSYGQAAILHLRVHKAGGAAASFALISADKVIS